MPITVLIIYFTDFNIPDLLFDLAVTYDCCHLKKKYYSVEADISQNRKTKRILQNEHNMFLLLIIVVYNKYNYNNSNEQIQM